MARMIERRLPERQWRLGRNLLVLYRAGFAWARPGIIVSLSSRGVVTLLGGRVRAWVWRPVSS